MTTKEAWERFERGLANERKARATRETYRSHVRGFLAFAKSADGETVEEKVAGYLSGLAEKRSAATQAQALNAESNNIHPLRRTA